MAQFEKHFVQDLTQDIKIRQCGTIVFNGDNLSNVITVDLYNGTEPYSGGGSVSCSVICPDGATVPITNGSISGNTVTVTMTGDCFALPGQIGVGVQVVSGDIRTTVLKAIYNVELLETDTIVDPGSRITASVGQLVSDIENAVAKIPSSDMASLMAGIAPTFSASTNYTAGAYVYYNGTLYRFTANHAAGSWTGTDATAVALGNDLGGQISDLKSATRNLVQGKLTNCSIESNGLIKANQANYDLYYAPITSGKTYTVSTDDTLNKLVCGYFANIPAVGDTASSGRVIDDDKTITAPLTGYIAFRVMTGYQYAQIEEGTEATAYIDPVTAVDRIARENISANSTAINTLNTKTYKTNNRKSSTSFADYLDPGSYNFDSTTFDSMTDAPADAGHNIYNLYVNSKAWGGGFAVQWLECYDGKVWMRTINTSTQVVLSDWKRIDPAYSNVLAGKKLVTAGDSYTAAVFSGDYAAYNGKNYGYYISQRNGMAFVNDGINGSTISVTNSSDQTEKSPFAYQRYTNVPNDTDYLTIWFGINDSAYGTLGTIDDDEVTTFYGAWNTVLGYYLENRPFMKVLIIIPTMNFGDAEQKAKSALFQQAVRDVAEKWGYPYLDWVKDKTIPAFFEREDMSDEALALRMDAYGWNGPVNGHPNPKWHEYESTVIEAKLRSI